MERAADPYRDTTVIDARAPRFNQAVVGLVSLAAVTVGPWWLLAVLAAQLAIGLTADRVRCEAYRLGYRLTGRKFESCPLPPQPAPASRSL
jgi:hypothetical protein